MVADGHAGGEVELFEFGAELAEADAGAVRDLGAAVQVQHFDVPAVLSKRPEKQPRRRRTGVTQELLAAAQEPINRSVIIYYLIIYLFDYVFITCMKNLLSIYVCHQYVFLFIVGDALKFCPACCILLFYLTPSVLRTM